ncbi:MAG: prephenate dehydratase, partial [Myxococcota bacterium]
AILAQLNERAELVAQVGRAKQAEGTSVYEATRERRIVDRLRAENPGPFPTAGIAPVFREIVSATRSLEEAIHVAYLGPEGTFSHQAAREHFGALAVLCAVPSISDVFAAVESGRAQLGIVPIENTTEGVVTQTLDAFGERDVTVCAERVLRVSNALLSKSGRIEDVQRVISHPQPLAQCRRWLDQQLPGVEREEMASTAAAAQRAAGAPECAAIGSLLSAEVYGLEVIAASIEDRRDNSTRFLVIGGDPPPPSGRDLTSVVFTIRRDEAGALVRLLEPFAREAVNLTSIQLRPIKGKPWEYLFFIDCEGHRSEAAVHRALEAAARVAHSTRVLGSFPRAESD